MLYKTNIMDNQPIKEENQESENKESIVQPEPETLHTPDPQKEMEGPVSSIMQKIKGAFDPNISKEDADKEKNDSL